MGEALAPELAALGAAIRKRRQETGKTLAEVGAGLWRHPHLSKVERGLEWPSLELVAHLEIQLDVPTGTYVKQYGAIEKLRWGHQETYRRSGVPAKSQPASLSVPILLYGADGSESPVVPAMIRDYDPDEPPYRTLHERIYYVVHQDEGRTECTVTWRIEAGPEGCEDFQFNLGYPGSAQQVGIAVLEGGHLTDLGRHGPRHLHLGITLDAPLAQGNRTSVTFAVVVSGLSLVPRFKYSAPLGSTPCEVTVKFVDRTPEQIWWFGPLPPEAAPGIPSSERSLELDEEQQAGQVFSRTRPGSAFGLGWSW